MPITLSKKEKISQGALRAFSLYGYKHTTMQIVADMSKIAKRTLYNHFESKEELFLHVNKNGVSLLIASIQQAMNEPNRPLKERWLDVLDEHLRFFSENHEHCKLLLSLSSCEHDRNEMLQVLLYEYFELLEKFINNLQDEGHVDRKLDVRSMASALFGMVGMAVTRRHYLNESFSVEEVKPTLNALCRGAIFAHIDKG